MFEDLKRLGRETAVYGLSTVVGRLLNFLLLPLYTHALAPSEYGVVATVFSYIAFFNVFFGYGMDFAYMRHAKAPPGEPEPPGVFPAAFLSVAATSLLLAGLMQAFAGPLSALADIPPELTDLTRYAAWILAFDALANLPFARLRLSHRAGLYASIKVANILMNLSLNYVFLVRMHLGVRGVFLASLSASGATLAMLGPVLAAQPDWGFDRAAWRRLLAFALPLVPGGLASMAVQVIDRPILKFLTDDATVGLYQANYRLSIFMMMAVNMFDAAWRPFFLQRGETPDGDRVIARVLTYFTAAGGLLFLAMSLFMPHAAALPIGHGRTLIHAAYWGGLAVVPWVTLGYLFNGIYVNLIAAPTLAHRSDLIAYATGIGALINVAANLFLIPRFGIIGAAAATMAAYAAMAASLYVLGRRVHPVPYEWGRLARAALGLLVIGSGARALGLGMEADRIALRLALVLAYPALLLATGFLEPEEKSRLRATLGL